MCKKAKCKHQPFFKVEPESISETVANGNRLSWCPECKRWIARDGRTEDSPRSDV